MTSQKIDIPSQKTKEHDNDEGFEETQSLMSESPSQGASSSGNYENDTIDASKIVVANSIKTTNKMQDKKPLTESQITTAKSNTLTVPKAGRNLERSTSLRKSTHENSNITKSIIPRRSESVRKPEHKNSTNTPKQSSSSIQKSSSRSSIMSSRSSLNSATSTCTVKKLPVRPNNNTLSKPVQRSPSNKSIGTANSKSNLRRSSSNSSSINNKPPRPQGLSFMKPTAASSTKQISLVPTSRQKKN